MKTAKSASRAAAGRTTGSRFRVPRMPIEWLDGTSWRLPSGKALADFALQAGFLAPLMFKTGFFEGPVTERALRRPAEGLASRELR